MAISKENLQQLKKLLEEEKNKLENDLNKIAKPVNKKEGDYETNYEDIGSDRDENATEVNQYAQSLAVEDSLENRLQNVLKALAKMKTGKYGICEKCQKEIPLERLMINPSARTCAHC